MFGFKKKKKKDLQPKKGILTYTECLYLMFKVCILYLKTIFFLDFYPTINQLQLQKQ